MQFTLIRCLPLALCCLLGACAVPVPQDTPPDPAPSTQVETPKPDQDPAPITAAEAAIARQAITSFIEVIQTVEPVAEAECRKRAPQANCDFLIVLDDRPNLPPNAYQTLDEDGRPIIAFTLPLIFDVQNRDEMAFILSHETAHHIKGHLSRQRHNANVGAAVFGQVAAVLHANDPEAIQTAQEVGAVLGGRSYSKNFELEADALGTEIAVKAGYNPLRGAEYFFRVPDPGDAFLGTHPAHADRVATVQRVAARYGFF